MKNILKIIPILLVASMIAGAFFLAVNNGWIAAGSDGGQPPVMTDSNGQTISQPAARPEGGDHDGGSLAGGAAGVLGTIIKLTIITIGVLLFQKGWNQIGRLKLKFARQ